VKAEDLALDQVSVGTKVLVLDESTGREGIDSHGIT